jgi:glycogen debranching enzyme
MTDRIAEARDILRRNDRGGYTVPTDRLYPYQWNWDSAFAAMGFATFDEPRAWAEVDSLLKGQWDDGLVPHIVFHQVSADYFPGPDLWGVAHAPPTSGITQPPVLASAVRRMLDGARDRAAAEARAAAVYPRLMRWHDWWERARDPAGTGLVAIIHPWESGMDNSPAWDEPIARVPRTTRGTYQRRDTGFVDPAQRPRQDDYDRYMHMVELYRDTGWDPAALWKAAPFKVTDVATNAILHRADGDLAALAGRFGTPAERAAIAARRERRAAAFGSLWNETRRVYQPLDLVAGKRLDVAASSGLLPLYAALPGADVAAMGDEIRRWLAAVRVGVPTAPADSPRFEPRRYWRGPVWAIVNWMLADGLARGGETALATRVRSDTMALIGRHGFCEYFDPTDGTGLGGGAFTWTAAVYLMWSASP